MVPRDFIRLVDAQRFGLLTDVERAIVHDGLLPREKQDILLAVYGVLTGRDSIQQGALLRAKPGSVDAGLQ